MSSTLTLQAPNAPWKAVVFGQIKDRNQSQSNGFKELIKLYNTALRKEKEIKDRSAALEKEIMTLRQENSGLKRSGATGGDPTLSRTASSPELDARLLKLQEELTVSYKRNSDNAQLMIDLTKKMKETQEDNEKKDQEATHFKQRLEEALLEQNRLKDKMEEDAKMFKIMQDELASLKITHERISQENTKLESQNQQLVDKLMKKALEEADKMNSVNEEYEKMKEAYGKYMDIVNKVTNNQAPPPMPNMPVVKKSAFFDSASFIDCSAILPSKAKRKVSVHTDAVNSVAFSRSGLILATGSTDKTVRLWDAPSGQPKTVLAGPTYSVMCVEFSPSDDTLLGASNDNACRIWGVDNCRLRHTLNGHVGKVLAATYADTQKVITGSHDRTIKLWDLTKGYCTRTVFCFSSLNDLCVAPDGSLLMSGHIDHHLRFWDIKSGEVVHDLDSIHDNHITSVTMANDGTKVLTNSRDNTMKLVDIRTHEVVLTLKDENYRSGPLSRSCLSPDGRYAAAGSTDGTLVFWNTLNGKVEKTIQKAHDSAILSCAWSPTGTQFASTGEKDKCLILWD